VVSQVLDPQGALLIPVLFVLVVPFEKLFPRHQQRLRRPLLGLDLAYALSQPVLGLVALVLGAAVGVGTLFWVPGLALRPLVMELPGAVQVIVGFVLLDVLVYWVHRFSHEVPFLWRFHSVHHSIETMDWISAFRNHPVDGLIIAPPIAFLIGAGFTLEVTGALAVIQILSGIFLHANVRWRLRPLQRLIATPDFHHWHHANETGAINSNYSVLLPTWDMAFGTWFMPPDRRPQIYGVDESVPLALASQMAYPFRGLRSPRWILRHRLRAIRALVASLRTGATQVAASVRRPRRPFHTPPSAPIGESPELVLFESPHK